MLIATCLAICLMTTDLCCAVLTVGDNGGCKQTWRYSREELLALRSHARSDQDWARWTTESFDYIPDNSGEMPDNRFKPKRKRGRRAGVRVQVRRAGVRHRLPLPTIIHGNVRSIRNKTDKLSLNCKFNSEYRDVSLICLTETWLGSKDADGTVHLDNFSLIRGDRILGNKQQGGGVCVYVNQRWCKNVTVKCIFCDDNVEYLTIACRPFHLPREFNNVYVTVAYVPPSGDYRKAAETLIKCVQFMDDNCPNGVNFLMGDFNDCDITNWIPNYQQHVTCKTRGDKTLDLVFCNVKDSYRVFKRPPLGISDHVYNMLYCLPTYKQKLQTLKSRKIQVKQWSTDNIDMLKACYECTDWNVLYDVNASLDVNVDICTHYIQFCIDSVIPTKTVKVYGNNKPWLTKDVKEVINKKKASLSNNRTDLRSIQRELTKKIKDAKNNYKTKVENMFNTNNTKDAWKGLKYLCGYVTKTCMPEPETMHEYVNELNAFYARFDDKDFSRECADIIEFLCCQTCDRLELSEAEVLRALNTAKPGKATGPDRICGRVVKSCRYELVKPMHRLYQESLDQCTVPTEWKTSIITPVPKVKIPHVMNDLRPVALTDVLMKCLESIIKRYLCTNFKEYFDGLQFAYKEGRCVDDAVATLLETVCLHLEKPKVYSRIMFIDFSSAFNTIQPHIMLRKLIDLNVNCHLIRWIYSYLTARPQYVRMNNVISDCIFADTGAPQGCVLSPLLFTIYTNDCKSSNESCTIIKYADDTAVIGNIQNEDESIYREQVQSFVDWCKFNHLNLNVKKTKEMILDFRKHKNDHVLVSVNNEIIQLVQSYKYLGVIIDDKLTFTDNIHHLYVKCLKRLHHMRILRNIGVDNHILCLFYKSIIESVLSYAIITWFGPSHKKDQNKLLKITRAVKRMGIEVTAPSVLYDKACIKMVNKIMKDGNHPLACKFNFLRSGKRLCVPKHHTTRYAKTFVPHGVKLFNHKIT